MIFHLIVQEFHLSVKANAYSGSGLHFAPAEIPVRFYLKPIDQIGHISKKLGQRASHYCQSFTIPCIEYPIRILYYLSDFFEIERLIPELDIRSRRSEGWQA